MATIEELEKRLEMLEGLEKRVKGIEEIEEIKKLHRDYIYWMSNHQWEDVIKSFADDDVAEMPNIIEQKGKKAIGETFRNHISKEDGFQKGGHMIIQPVNTVDGDHAKGYWSWYHLNTEFKSPSGQSVQLLGPNMQAKYDCEYKKEHGRWKFTKLKLTRPWPEQRSHEHPK